MTVVNNRQDFLKALKEYLPEHSVGVEIGVLHGDFSAEILKEINSYLLLIDPYVIGGMQYGSNLNNIQSAYSTEQDYKNVVERFNEYILKGQVTLWRNFSYDVVTVYPNQSFDYAYHDGSHIYKELKRDLDDWLPKMKIDAVIAGHDFFEFEGFGVVQAVEEFMKENNFEMIIYNTNGGDWAIKRKDK